MPSAVPPPCTQPRKRGWRFPTPYGATNVRNAAYVSPAGSPSRGSGSAHAARTASGICCQTAPSRMPSISSSMSSSMRCPSARSSRQSPGSSIGSWATNVPGRCTGLDRDTVPISGERGEERNRRNSSQDADLREQDGSRQCSVSCTSKEQDGTQEHPNKHRRHFEATKPTSDATAQSVLHFSEENRSPAGRWTSEPARTSQSDLQGYDSLSTSLPVSKPSRRSETSLGRTH